MAQHQNYKEAYLNACDNMTSLKTLQKEAGIVLAHSEFSGLQGRFKLKCQSCITKKDILTWLKRRGYRFGLTQMTIGFLQIGHEQAIIRSLPTKKQ